MHFKANKIGPYVLDNPIGKGAMGDVWRATHADQQVTVAIKFLQAHKTKDEWAIDAFKAEVRSAACLRHENAVMVLDHGLIDSNSTTPSAVSLFGLNTPYLVMEYIHGKTWQESAGQLKWTELSEMIVQLLDVLAHAHARGVIHRDIKPENIIVESGLDGTMNAVLTDFGLAQALSELDKTEEVIAGTPAYMAPEQLMGEWRQQGPWTDLYSLACTIWRMISVEAPYGNALSFQDIAYKHINSKPPSLNNTIEIPKGLSAWLKRMLVKRPQNRFTSAAEALFHFRRMDTTLIPGKVGLPKTKKIESDLTQDLQEKGNQTQIWSLSAPFDEATVSPTQKKSIPIPLTWRKRIPPRKHGHVKGVGLYMFGLRAYPYVGRVKVRDNLWQSLLTVANNGVQAITISGPEGSGKSRLSQWLCERAKEVGAAQCFQINHNQDAEVFSAIREAICNEMRLQGLHHDELLSNLEKALAHDPNLIENINRIASFLMPDALPKEQRAQLTEWEIHGLVLKLLLRRCKDPTADSKPNAVIVAIDDAHYGAASLRLCRAILNSKQITSIPILFVLNIRPEEVAQQQLERIEIAALKNHHRCTSIHLSSISEDEHRQMVRDLLHMDPLLSETLVQHTGGNPHFAKETIADWIRRDVLIYQKKGFRLKEGIQFEVPQSIEQAWSIRLRAATKEFGDEEHRALSLAAQMGAVVRLNEWFALQPDSKEETLRWIVDELILHRLARRSRDFKGWRFVHPVIRRILENKAKAKNTWRMDHLAIAKMLGQTRRIDSLERTGRHLALAGELQDGLIALIRGARIRQRRCEYSQSIQILDFTENMLKEKKTPSSDESWGHAWAIRFEIAHDQNNRATYLELVDKLRRSMVRYHWPRTHSHFLSVEALDMLNKGQYESARIVFKRGELLADEVNDRRLKNRHRRGQILTNIRQGHLEIAETQLQSLHNQAKHNDDKFTLGMCDLYAANILLQQSELKDAELRLESVIKHFRKYNLQRYAAEGSNMLGDVFRRQARHARAEEEYQKAVQQMTELNHPELIVPNLNLAMIWIEKKEFQKAKDKVQTYLPVIEERGRITLLSCAHAIVLCASTALADWDDWQLHYRALHKLIARSGLVDTDIAILCETAMNIAKTIGKTSHSRLLQSIASSQRQALRRGKTT